MNKECPCGSGKEFSACCEPVIEGKVKAATPEALMRARYAAYAETKIDFLFNSIAPDQRATASKDDMEKWARSSRWLGLQILNAPVPAPDAVSGTVEFIARYSDPAGAVFEHHELSEFRKISGEWFFYDGKLVKNQPFHAPKKTNRNDPCPCGSGKKYKKCCGR